MLAYLFQAMASPFGIVILTTNQELLRQRLYQERKKLNDPLYECLQFRISPSSEGEIWIIKGNSREEKESHPQPE